MKTYPAKVSACEKCVSKKDNCIFYMVHLVDEETGHVFRASSNFEYDQGESVDIIKNYPRFGSAGIITK